MSWIWQHPDWPNFTADRSRLQPLEARFMHEAGRRIGSWQHLDAHEQTELRVQWLSTEALETSAIEGEILDRDSLHSSIRRHFGLSGDRRTASPAEAGVADMMVSLFSEFDRPLDHDMLWRWHRMLMGERRAAAGAYRQHREAMQIVSGPDYAPMVHYEAPPSERVEAEMDGFLAWYAETEAAQGELSALTRAGTAHLYFVCIHPFEDGNGRIGRALAEKALARSLGQPSLIALSRTVARRRKAYYAAGPSLDITDWLVWFAGSALDAQLWSERRLVRLIQQAQLFERFRGALNRRQEKALLALFRFEPDGFEGGLSAGNYQAITRAPASTGNARPRRPRCEGRTSQERRTPSYPLLAEPARVRAVGRALPGRGRRGLTDIKFGMIEQSAGDERVMQGQPDAEPDRRTIMQCRLCAGSGRIVLLAGMFADMRVRSSFRTDACHFCRGSGESARAWPEWEEEQAGLREAKRVAAADA